MEIQDDFQVDFRAPNSISSVLGFWNQVYKEGIHESQNVVNILSINSILVNVVLMWMGERKTLFTVSFQMCHLDIKSLRIRETLCIFVSSSDFR